MINLFNDRQFISLDTIYIPTSYYKIKSNNKLFKDTIGLIGTNRIVCYTSKMKSINRMKYIDKSDIEIPEDKKHWKVILPRVLGNMNAGFANLIIGAPDSVFSHTYFGFRINSEFEAESLKSYLKCKIINDILKTRKPTMHVSKHTLRWIPLPPLDRIWDDKKIEEYIGFN